jgi:hypothetical protein
MSDGMNRPLRETVLIHAYFSYSSWGMFRIPLIYLPWWYPIASDAEAGDDDHEWDE